MKKLTLILLTVCMCLSSCIMFTACFGHDHVFSNDWSQDETLHWHKCTVEDCAEISDKAAHTWNDGEVNSEATAKAVGEKTYTCTVCNMTKKESYEFTGVTKEKWNTAIETANFENITFGYTATFTSGYAGEAGPHVGTFKISGDKMNMNGHVITDAKTLTATKSWYLDSALAIVDSFDKFQYDKAKDCYNATEDIVYNVTVMGYDTTITAKNVSAVMDENANIVKIACNMTQDFKNNGTPTTYVLDVEFTFADYGTTTVE